MKEYAYILLSSNKIIKHKLNNPNNKFKVSAQIDNKKKTFMFNYKKENSYHISSFFSKRIIFYKWGNPNPLNPDFSVDDMTKADIDKYLESSLLENLYASSSDNKMTYSLGLILGLAGILAIVLIAVFG